MNLDTTTLDAVTLLKDHGGRPGLLAQTLGIQRSALLDLSNAVSPFAYPLGDIPAQILADLPYESGALAEAAAAYYSVSAKQLLAASGTQHIIQCLPAMRQKSTVLLPRLGYAEHARRWQAGGHRCVFYDELQADSLSQRITAERADVLVLIHPNNPTGASVRRSDIVRWRSQLPVNGQIIVDEAFIDVQPEASTSALLPMSGLLVLRSVGKFFGVPGLRLGFLLADEAVIEAVREQLGPWAINAVAQWAGEIMLRDSQWQQQARERLQERAREQYQKLTALGLAGDNPAQTPYFTALTMPHRQAEQLCRALLARHIAVRYYDQHPQLACLRVGLTASSDELERLLDAWPSRQDIQEGLSRRAI